MAKGQMRSNKEKKKPKAEWNNTKTRRTLTHAACAATGTSIAKTYGGPMGYRRRPQARTVPRMSQCLRSLV
jgi:hypothetical protein